MRLTISTRVRIPSGFFSPQEVNAVLAANNSMLIMKFRFFFTVYLVQSSIRVPKILIIILISAGKYLVNDLIQIKLKM
jgi:hypothetical protein